MKLVLEKLPYAKNGLDPIMSEDTIRYHRDKLAAGYVNRYNEGKGDAEFNEAGAFLHNIFFPQLKPPGGRNLPHGKCLELINEKYESFDSFKEEFQSAAMSVQGSGWVYMDSSGNIRTIKNHQIKPNIILLIDWWEHAWALDYQQDKKKYLENMWKVINWDIINDRLNVKKESGVMLRGLVVLANHLDKIGRNIEADFIDSLIKESKKKKKKKKKGEKRTPTNPKLWSRAKAAAKEKFDVYPSAYANGWAVQWYGKRGGGWRGPKPKK
jgi:Fe-Mn family superoxide dismutase